MGTAVVRMQRIQKSFGLNPVLNSIDFEVASGSIMGLIGKNGAGKTTLIKCLLGLLKPDHGKTEILGESSWNLSVAARERIGYVPQVLTGFRWMRVQTMLEYTGAFYRHWNEKKVNQLLKEWELDSWAKIGGLSEGERQKLSIVQAMGHEPDVYIFDEPVASLDPVARRRFIHYLIDLNSQENKTMLFSTHITSDLERVAADIALLKNGKITFTGDLADLKEQVKRLYIQSDRVLPDDIELPNMLSRRINQNSGLITVNGIDSDTVKQLERQLAAVITVESLNLEDIFLELNQ